MFVFTCIINYLFLRTQIYILDIIENNEEEIYF